ncbi:MAG: DUF4384 domain-containing protein [Treponema sp.]|jgi:hypothetical protein|nr:DUF4384 domain-containing protein [Treponema sp.]
MKKMFVLVCLSLLPAGFGVFAQSLDGKIAAAVKGLEQSRRLAVAVEPPAIRGTNTVTALSEYLQGEIRHYATNSPAFTVVEPARSAPAGNIGGWYIDMGTSVRVTLRLAVAGDTAAERASKQFDVPIHELSELGLDWHTPENIGNQEEAENEHEEMVNLEEDLTNATDLDFEAYLDSPSRTYYDGDYMTISVRANGDCYVIIRHIGVDGNARLIFPNRSDTDNFLKKDETRTLFENPTRVRLHEPFGQEQLLITVSTTPFNDLENAMISPVTADSFADAVRKARGLTVELLPPEDAEYRTKSVSFSILPLCHTDFEFDDPARALREIAEDVRQRGGRFEGNDREGFYVINNGRVSYTVQGTVITLITRLPPEAASRLLTRGPASPLQVDLAIPRASIPGQIASTGDKIKQAGGVFSGDVRGGNFAVQKPVEIAGNYRVANENVTVLITKYPSLFAGTIKSKIKEYFSE